MALQFESSLQNLVYQMDAGSGRKVIQAVLFGLFAVAMAALYTFSNFQGLRDARAFEEAQLARNIVRTGQLQTQCVRPLSMGHLIARDPAGNGAVQTHPDLLHPPLWPLTLAAVWRVIGSPETGAPTTATVQGWDYLPVALSHMFTILSALWIWLIGRKLFDLRVAGLSAGAFLISDMVWRHSVLGGDMGLALFCVLGAVYAALWAGETPAGVPPDEGAGSAWRWLLPLVGSALLTAGAFLTRYITGTIGLALFFYLGTSRRRHAWAHASVYVGLVVLLVMPWLVRNILACGHPLGLVFHAMLTDSYLFPGDVLFRSLAPELPDFGAALYAVQLKMMTNLRQFSVQGLGWADGGILLALFGAMYLHRFVRPSSRRLRWCLIPAALVLVLVASTFGEESLRGLVVYWPLAIPYAWAFFLVLLDRLQFEIRFFAAAAISIVMFLAGLPLLLNVLPPRTGLPYPPYFHRYIGWVSNMLEPGDVMVTDIPWATAWYGGKTAILLPDHIDDFYTIHEHHQPIAMAYFTTETRNKPWVRGLSDPSAPEHSWYQIFAEGKVPTNFPLTHGRFIAGTDQFLLADRVRW
ncbi:MAG: hypothetical protein RBT03_10445 [Kiritimatiellia bacterium]|jgi:hypothetical protein|nr:hypothetical protein [Kiritimatiellia bacterium]